MTSVDNGSKKLVAVSMKVERPSKVELTGASSETRRLEVIPVSRRQGSENEEV